MKANSPNPAGGQIENSSYVAKKGFNMAERFYTDNISGSVDIAYTPKFNTWQGETTIQLLLKDLRDAD